jgi:hypothetical protein
MPVIAALVGAITTGLFYWIVWGNGGEVIDRWLSQRHDSKRRDAAGDAAQRAAIRSLTDSRDGAVALMAAVAQERGEPTPEQLAVIKAQMRDVLGYGADLESRLIAVQHAVKSAPTPENVVSDLRDMMQRALTKAEFNELFLMLRKVAALHGGPAEGQERIISFAERQLPPYA